MDRAAGARGWIDEERRELRGRAWRRDAGAQPRVQHDEAVSRIVEPPRGDAGTFAGPEWKPEVGDQRIDAPETTIGDAHHRYMIAIDDDIATYDASLPAEGPSPERIADDGGGRRAGVVVALDEQAADRSATRIDRSGTGSPMGFQYEETMQPGPSIAQGITPAYTIPAVAVLSFTGAVYGTYP